MASNRSYAPGDDIEYTRPSASPGAPGRLPATARIGGTRIIYRVESGDAVRPDADRAVDAASSSSGQALPAELRVRFEGSLGADLSGVRIHTGAESAAAASSVAAKAYAFGQDIHFADGRYDPTSSEGQFLIAHEVAHTVQQSGAAPRRQDKLEVSSVGDSAELEADAAAAAMVAGTAAEVRGSTGVIARAGDDVPPEQKERNWGAEIGPGTVATGNWDEAPRIMQLGVQLAQTTSQQNAFAADWGTAQGSYNMVGPLCDDYDAAAQQAENQGLTGAASDTRAEGVLKKDAAGGDLAHAVEGGQVAGTTTGITVGQSTDQKTIDDARSKVKSTTGDLDAEVNAVLHTAVIECQKALRDVEDSGSEYKIAVLKVNDAVNDLQSAKEAKGGADDAAKKTQLEREKAIIIAGIGAVASAMKIGSGMAGVSGKVAANKGSDLDKAGDGIAAGKDVVDGVQGIVTFWVSQEFDSEIHNINMHMQSIAQRIAGLSVDTKTNNVDEAIEKVNEAANAVTNKRAGVVQAEQKRRDALKALAEKTRKNAAANGASDKQQDALYSAIRGLPLVEAVVSRTTDIVAKTVVPTYSFNSGRGAAMCENTDDFILHVGQLVSTRTKFTPLRDHWKGVHDRVKALIEGLHSSAG